jgi:probable HAF family extracellular repeat protein
LIAARIAFANEQSRYVIVDLGDGKAVSINDHGAVLKNTVSGSFVKPSDGSSYRVGFFYGRASKVSNNGEVVGGGSDTKVWESIPYIWRSGNTVSLPLNSDEEGGTASGINDRGDVVINTSRLAQTTCPDHLFSQDSISFVLTRDRRIYLDKNLDGKSNSVLNSANAINNKGQVVGKSIAVSCGDEFHAFLFSEGRMVDIGRTGQLSEACCVNESGQVAGTAGGRAFLYADGKMQDLGTLGGATSDALGMNNLGEIVGSSRIFADGDLHAFIYRENHLVELEALLDAGSHGWLLNEATGINESGKIVGNGAHNGAQHSFLLVPAGAR